jgi:hypothetical protein
MNSRQKGKRGELDAAKAWVQNVGGEARRGQQFAGGNDSPDVVTSFADIHLEVKRTERGNPYGWVDQAVADCQGKCPVVLHRRNNREWLAIVRLSDVQRLAEAVATKAETLGGTAVPADLPG